MKSNFESFVEDEKPTYVPFSGDAHSGLSKRRVVTTKLENVHFFWKILTTNCNQSHPNLCYKKPNSFHVWNNRVASPLIDTFSQKLISFFIFLRSQFRVTQHDFLSPKRRYWEDFWLQLSERQLELTGDWKTRLSEQPDSAISKYLQPARYYGDARSSTFKCRRTRLRQKRVSKVRSGEFSVSLGGCWLEHGCSLPTGHRNSFLPFKIQRY